MTCYNKLSRMMRLSTLGGILSAVAFNTMAARGLQPVSVPEPELWGGAYLGIYGSAGSGSLRTAYNQQTTTSSYFPPVTSTLTSSGSAGQLSGNTTAYLANAFLGYQYHHRATRLLLGGQFEGALYSSTNLKSSKSMPQYQTAINQNNNTQTITTSASAVSARYDLQSMVSFIARFGGLVRPNTLVYGLVGPTGGDFVIPDNVEPVMAQKSQWVLGLSSGAGVEQKINTHWSLFAEYRYLHFHVATFANTNRFNQVVSSTNTLTNRTTTATSLSWKSNVGINVGNIGVSYRC